MTRRSINFGGRRPSGQMFSISKQNDDILSPTLQRYKDDQFNSLPKRHEPKQTNDPKNVDQFHSLPKRKEDQSISPSMQPDSRYPSLAQDESDEDQYHSLPVRRGEEMRTNGQELEKSTSFRSYILECFILELRGKCRL